MVVVASSIWSSDNRAFQQPSWIGVAFFRRRDRLGNEICGWGLGGLVRMGVGVEGNECTGRGEVGGRSRWVE